MAPDPVPDAIDDVLEAWTRERPDLDLEAVGLIGRLGRAAVLLGPLQDRVFATHGLGKGEFDVLASIRRAGPPYVLTPSRLADQMMLSRAGMTSRLDRLEKAGLVTRALDPDNRSSFQVTLTDHGLDVVDRAMTDHTANLTDLVSGLSAADARALDVLLRKLLNQLAHPAANRDHEPGGAVHT